MNYSQQHYGAGDRDCQMCQGSGYVTYEVPEGHPKFGRIFPCPTCKTENSEEAINERIRLAGVGEDGWKMDREFWSIGGRRPLEIAVKDMAKQLEGGNCSGWLTLVSSFGLGKSAMGQWLVIQAVRAGVQSMYITAGDFQEAVSDEINGIGNKVDRAAKVNLLVFDQPDWLYSKGDTYQVNQARKMLDARYQNRHELCTVLILNLLGWEIRHDTGLAAIFNRAEEGKIVISKAAGVREEIGERIEA